MSIRKVPKIIREVGFDFKWDERKVWALILPVEKMALSKLVWHFEIPFWNTEQGYYDLKPNEVVENPEKYLEEYTRTLNCDLRYPLDIMYWRGKWLLLDGLHRLVKAKILGYRTIKVRKVPGKLIPRIRK